MESVLGGFIHFW